MSNLKCIRLLLWIGIVLNLLWFLLFCFATDKILTALALIEVKGYFMRLYGIFPLSWAILFLFALKDVEKNKAIIHAGIITGLLIVISLVAFHFVFGGEGLFHWLSAAIMLFYAVLLFICRPKPTKRIEPAV
jgi:hypothetical protein